MKSMRKPVLGVLVLGLLIWGVASVALAADKNANMAPPGFTGYPPDQYGAMDTGKGGWMHSQPSDTGKGYPPDYSNVPAWTQNNASAPGPNTHAQTQQSQPAKTQQQ